MPAAMENENAGALNADMSLSTLYGMDGKVALITGGGSGIGAMMATALARHGAKVYIASRKDISAFARDLPRCVAMQCDVGNMADVTRMIEEIKTREGKLNILINNAGTNFNAPLGKYSSEMFDKVMTVNVRSIFDVTQAAAPLLYKSAKDDDSPSRVINISSINGIRIPIGMDTYAYSASKAAVIRLSQHLASSMGKHGVLVNSVCPGPFESRMMRGMVKTVGKKTIGSGTCVGRMGSPQV